MLALHAGFVELVPDVNRVSDIDAKRLSCAPKDGGGGEDTERVIFERA